MTRKNCAILVVIALSALFALGCDLISGGQPPAPAPVPAPAPAVAPAPAPAPVAAPVPPATPLMPIADAQVAPDDASGSGGARRPSGAAGIDKALPGPETDGEELIGAYICHMGVKGLKLPLGLNLPSFGCRIFKADSGALRIGPTGSSVASIKGSINNPKASGFFISGGYTFPGNEFKVKARMARKGANEFIGRGKATLNDSSSTKFDYTLKMTKQ